MSSRPLKPGDIVRSSLFPEPVQVLVVTSLGQSVKLIGKGLDSGKVYEPVLDGSQLATLQVSSDTPPFDADPVHFRLGIEAMRLALAYEYDPYFSLSIARVDPLPHQLEAVYDYFIKLPTDSLPPGRRPRGWQDHHGRSSPEGAQDPRLGRSGRSSSPRPI